MKFKVHKLKKISRLLSDLVEFQWNFEIGFRCLVLLEKISFDTIFEAGTQKFAIRC